MIINRRIKKKLKVFSSKVTYSLKVPIAPNYKGVGLQNTSKPHSYHLKYGYSYDFTDR